MQHALDAHRAIKHAEENHVAPQGRHAQAGGHILTADVAQRPEADALALFDRPGEKSPGVGPTALAEAITDVEEVLPGLRRERDWHHQVERLPLALVVGLASGPA